MADLKISQLNEVTAQELTPTDVLPIVNNEETKKVTVQTLMSSATGSGNGLPVGSEFFIVPANQAAPDGELYYCINTDSGVPFMQGEIMGAEINILNSLLLRSQSRIDHALEIPVPGWKQVQIESAQINDSVFLNSNLLIISVSESGQIYKSYNAGMTWEHRHTSTNGTPIKKLFYNYSSQADVSGQTRISEILLAVGGKTLYQSEDQGETWTEYDGSSVLTYPNENYIDIRFAIDSSSKAAQGFPYLLGNMGSLVNVRITPPVASFLLVSQLPSDMDYKGFDMAVDLVNGILFHVICNSVDVNGVSTGHLFISPDETPGNPFNWVDTYNQLNQKFYGIGFPSANGIIVGEKDMDSTPSGVIHLTPDGCQTWIVPDLSTLSTDILKDIALGKHNFWVVGNNSTILRSTDGINWTKVDSFITDQGLGHNLTSVSILGDYANVTGDDGAQGYYYYYVPSVLDGVTYTFTAVDTLWIKILQQDGTYKNGFVSALNVTTV